jgi:probable H4MPT-linked C1 transfer pathway protein
MHGTAKPGVQQVVIGWDIGGAHLKAARAENGRIVAAVQVASPLRYGLERVGQAFAEAKVAIGEADVHAATMTGELADTFTSRSEGVALLAAAATRELGQVRLYAGRAGFIAADRAGQHVADIASANWHASAALAARTYTDALFVDIGSTTTDLVPIRGGAVAARGYTDAERLACGELVYTGMVRSFLMAVSDKAPFAGQWTSLIRENFATMADAHRILGTLPDGADQMQTADGREKTVPASRARLARIVGRDADDADDAAWFELARWFAEAQIKTVLDSAMLVLSQAALPPGAPLVVAGVGEIVAREVARRLGRHHVSFDTVFDAVPEARAAAANGAPAAAVALLASHAATGTTPAGTRTGAT